MTADFDWDPAKDSANRRNHGVSFGEAQLTFLDPDRVIALDLRHSQDEQRYYCFGRVSAGILTIRFIYRGSIIRIIGAGYWRRGKKLYEAHTKVHQ